MSTALVVGRATRLQPRDQYQAPLVPWLDPYTVSRSEMAEYIGQLEVACRENPVSADLRTCLGMAYAVNHQVEKSRDALEEAIAVDPMHFWAQLKYAELQYRLRALPLAEEETLKAAALAQNAWQLSLARKQLLEVRRLIRHSGRSVDWGKPPTMPLLVLSAMMLLVFVVMSWR